MCVLVTQSYPTLCNTMDCSPPGSSVHGTSPGKNTGVSCLSLLQRISWPWNWTRVSCITGGFFTIWAAREAPLCVKQYTLAVGEAYVSFSCGLWDLRCVMLEPSLLYTDSTCGVQAEQLWCAGSRAHRLQKLYHVGLGTPQQCGTLVPWPGIEPASPGLQGGCLTTGPSVVIYTLYNHKAF